MKGKSYSKIMGYYSKKVFTSFPDDAPEIVWHTALRLIEEQIRVSDIMHAILLNLSL